MRSFLFSLIIVIGFVSCKKTPGDGNSGGGNSGADETIHFSEIAAATRSSALITYFATNRAGNSFIVSVIDESANRKTYAGDGAKWELLGAFQPADAAVSEKGTVVYFEKDNVLKRYTGTGSPETINLPALMYPKVMMGLDGNFYAGSSNGKVMKSGDEGKTWTATDIPQNRFNYSGNLAVGLCVQADGKMYSYTSGSKLYQSTDNGSTWTTVNLNFNVANAGYVDLYSPIMNDNNGYIYVRGTAGVSIVNTGNLSTRSVPFQPAALRSFEQFEKFTTDANGVLYATATNLGYDHEQRKQATSIYKYGGASWEKIPLPLPFVGFSGMNIHATQAGVISAANGVLSKGLYGVDATGKYKEIGTPVTFENVTLDMSPHTNGKVYCVVRHATPIGMVMGAALNPAYPSLLVLENGQWRHTGKVADGVFVASNGDVYAMQSVFAGISKDGGATWQEVTHTADDPQNLRNFLSANVLHFTELKGVVYAYLRLTYGGTGGVYVNYYWVKANTGSAVFEKMPGKGVNYDPALNQVPLATAARGATGYHFKPYISFEYYPMREKACHFTPDGASYQLAGSILPFAGSPSGHYIALGAGAFLAANPDNPMSFTRPIKLTLPSGEINMNLYNGANYFTTWARFGLDNKLYLRLGNKIYMGKETL